MEDIPMPTFGLYVPPAVIDAAAELGESDGAKFLFAVLTEMYGPEPIDFASYADEPWYPTFIVATDLVEFSTGPSYAREA